MKYEITKEFKFAAGHRVPTQNVDPELALTNINKCRHLHGHEYTVAVTIGSDQLNFGVVTDFNHLNKVKEYIDKNFDHKFILWIDDPLFEILVGSLLSETKKEIKNNVFSYLSPRVYSPNYIIDNTANKDETKNNVVSEYVKSFTIVNFIPTAESIAEHFAEYIEKSIITKIELGCKLIKVEVFETPTSSAIFFCI